MYNRPTTQEDFLKNRQTLFIEAYPDYKKLFEFLESKIENSIVVPMFEENIEKIILRGELKEFSGKFIQGKVRECHANSAKLAKKNKDLELVTGYAFTKEDGLWRQHSWIQKNQEVLETTPIKRDYYFGFVLSELEKKDFINQEG